MFELAQTYANMKKYDKSIKVIKGLIDKGFRDCDALETGAAFKNMQKRSAFKKLIKEIKDLRKKEKAKAESEIKKKTGPSFHINVFEDCKLVMACDCDERIRNDYTKRLDEYCKGLQKHLFFNPLKEYYHIVVPRDFKGFCAKIGRPSKNSAGFTLKEKRLIVVDFQSGPGTTIHELSHAIHFDDQEALGQTHPKWILEMLGTLYEVPSLKKGKPTGHVNWRLPGLKKAFSEGSYTSWRSILSKADKAFGGDKNIDYAAVRFIGLYLQEKDLLHEFYRQYVANHKKDKNGINTLEKVLGGKLDKAEAEWKKWVQTLQFPPR